MKELSIGEILGILSIVMNTVVVLFQAKMAHAIADVKVYMHENFTRKE